MQGGGGGGGGKCPPLPHRADAYGGCPIRAKTGLDCLPSTLFHRGEHRLSDDVNLFTSTTIEASQSNVKIKAILTLVSHTLLCC